MSKTSHAPASVGPSPTSAGRRLSPVRVITGILLAAWAGMFWFLWLAHRSTLFLGIRTLWIVPIGAVTLTLCALGRFLTARVPEPEPLTARRALVVGLMIVPVLLITVLPPTTLGSFALKGRSSFKTAGATLTPGQIQCNALNWIDIASSPLTQLSAKALEKCAGSTATLTGFVAAIPGTPPDELYLTRFVITCCVLDATIAQVHVVNVTPGKYKPGEWLTITGTMYPLGRDVLIDASKATAVPRPSDPYVTPS
jgi:uncharacterized repeat protein (TIGR03943 family)